MPKILVFDPARIVHALGRLTGDERGGIAVMMGFLFPVLLAGFGLGFEISNWYMKARAMQNAADAAVLAAASNGEDNYDVEAKAVAARYGFVTGTNNVTVTPSNAAPCPADPSITPPCYSVAISSAVPLFLSQLVGYTADITLNGARQKVLTSAAVAIQTKKSQPLCMLGLDTNSNSTAIRSNGGPSTNFTGCSVMSDSAGTCNGSNLQANYGLAHATDSGCGNKQKSDIPIVPDPYAYMASAIPTDLPTRCSNTYSQESRHGQTWSGGTTWTGSKTLSGTASLATNTLVCGDLRLTGDVTINAPSGAVLYIENGLLDLQGHTLQTANGSSVTIVFTGDPASTTYNHFPTDNSGGSNGVLNIEAPKTGPFPGMALYQDPSLTHNVDFTYAGNSPTWDITGGTYWPNANVTISGVVNKSSNGADCFVMVAKDILINGNGAFYSQTPDGSGCRNAGLNMPTATIPGRSKLVY